MKSSSARLLYALLVVVSVNTVATRVQADPLPGRDLLKFSQLPMINTPIADPIGNPNPNSLAPAAVPIGGITNYGGHDEISTLYGYHGFGTNDLPVSYSGLFMADDFGDKLNSPVVHVKWWGSYLGDRIFEPVNQFLISFESDQPSDATNSFSHPAQPLLNQVVDRAALAPGSGTFTEKLVRGPDPVRHESLYEYNAELHLDKPFPEKADTVYWLKIAAMVDIYQPATVNVFDPLHPSPFSGSDVLPTVWGWHNRDYSIQDTLASAAISPGEHLDGNINGTPIYHFQDDAVTGRASIDMTTSGGRVMPSVIQNTMSPTFYLNGADGPAGAAGALGIGNYSKDLAFELYTTQVPEPGTCALFLIGGVGLAAMRRRVRC